MERIGQAGVTVILKVDHERVASRNYPWTLVLSGPGLGEQNLIRTDAASLDDGMRYLFEELRKRPGDWVWLKEYE